jgi:thiamine-phosphate pyrophosphorylase
MSNLELVQIFSDRVYPITDVRLSGLSHAEQVERLSEGGATLIQLREKHASPREFYKEAERALLVARKHDVRIIINDRVDIALALKADGVHLGQDDLPPEAARRLLGDKAIIGFSTHTIAQAREAVRMPVDYVAFGPIFVTASKADPDQTVGLDGLHRVREAIGSAPLVAIGGINQENATQVLSNGVDAIAVISALLAKPGELALQTRTLVTLCKKAHPNQSTT